LRPFLCRRLKSIGKIARIAGSRFCSLQESKRDADGFVALRFKFESLVMKIPFKLRASLNGCAQKPGKPGLCRSWMGLLEGGVPRVATLEW
jgi:hypothetical protein